MHKYIFEFDPKNRPNIPLNIHIDMVNALYPDAEQSS